MGGVFLCSTCTERAVQVWWYSCSLVSAGTQHQGWWEYLSAALWSVITDLCDCQLAAFHSQSVQYYQWSVPISKSYAVSLPLLPSCLFILPCFSLSLPVVSFFPSVAAGKGWNFCLLVTLHTEDLTHEMTLRALPVLWAWWTSLLTQKLLFRCSGVESSGPSSVQYVVPPASVFSPSFVTSSLGPHINAAALQNLWEIEVVAQKDQPAFLGAQHRRGRML